MADDSAMGLLRDVDALRLRARSDRWGYWLPLLLLGLLILAGPLVYRTLDLAAARSVTTVAPQPMWHIPGLNVRFVPLLLFSGIGFVSDPTAIGLYWLGVVVVGMGATVAWYRWRGRRVGVETSTRTFVLVGVVGLVFLLGIVPAIVDVELPPFFYDVRKDFWINLAILVLAGGGAALALRRSDPGRRVAWRVALGVLGVVVALLSATTMLIFASSRGYAPLLVVAMALLALAVVERSRFFTVVTVLFALATMLVNIYDIENVAMRLNLSYQNSEQLAAFSRVLLPAIVLIVGGIVGAVGAGKHADD